ncbi:MAG: phenylalanine--tRNA ligase subunit beta [Thermoanaerobaculia bacterium]
MKYSLNLLKKFVDLPDSQELFSKLTNLGFNLESFEEKEGDITFELEITSNRPDVLSHFGLAREISALMGCNLRKEKMLELPIRKDSHIFKIDIEDPSLCPRYSALLVEDVKVEDSPLWLKNALEAVGFRPINNLVDISNYVLASIGHPTHPFDLDTIYNNNIIVRKAREKEKLKTLDGVERTFKGGELLIADPEKPIGLAGIMGGEETEIKTSTKRVLFESAYFSPSSIRRTCRWLGIQTEASQRFGRGADIENTILALQIIAYLIEELKCGKVAGFIYDFYPETAPTPKISLDFEKLDGFFDLKFDRLWVEIILNSLGFKIEKESDRIFVYVPSYRQDVREEVDIYEEVGRFYGYDRLPQKLPEFELGKGWEVEEVSLIKKAQDLLSHFGLTETISYVYSKGEEIENFESFSERKPAVLSNPLSAEEPFLRVSLIPGLLRTYRNNLSKNIKDVDIFEVGKVYSEEEGYKEYICAGILVSGRRVFEKNSVWEFSHLKGIMEKFILSLGISDFKFKPKKLRGFSENGSAIIEIDGVDSGIIGEVQMEAPYPVWVSEVGIDIFKSTFKKIPQFKPISQFPAIEIDMTLGHPREFTYEDLVRAIKGRELPNLVSLSFKDRFVKEERIYTTITLKFQSFERSLTQEEVNKTREELANYLLSNYPIKF